MDMKQLEALVYVVETCSFSRAGELLHLTQPTISSHIAALERELKIKLIVRTTKEIYPSEAGKLLYGYAKEILQKREEALQAIGDFFHEMRGTITVAASSIPGQYSFPN
jgi:DNA-binding transcriptional LysR family regulator